jgi:NADPH oxidase 2
MLQILTHSSGQPPLNSPSHYSKPYTILHRLITRPSLVPILTNHHFPNIFRFLAIAGLNILSGYNSIEYSTDYKLYGWLTIANAGLALLLSARSNLFSLILCIPSSTLLIYHRFIGFATFVHATLHFSLNIRHDIITSQLIYAVAATRIRVGIMAWLSLAILFTTSLPFVRRRFFEVFYYSHFLFFVFVVGALIHTTNGPEFLLPGLGLWAVDRLIRFWYNFRSVEVKESKWNEGGVTKFKVEGMRSVRPGQIVWVQIPGISWFNWHPFSIASAPGEDTTIAVRGLGGFTKKVQQLGEASGGAEKKEDQMVTKLKIRLDGPYGVGGIQWGLYPVTVIVAGGIGITPGISIISHIMARASTLRDAEKELGKEWHIHLLWVIKAACHAEWFEKELKNFATIAADPAIPATFDVTIHVTGSMMTQLQVASSSTTPSSEIEIKPVGQDGGTEEHAHRYSGLVEMIPGRPDVVKWMENVKRVRPGLNAAVSTCGPRQLLDDARKAAAKASRDSSLFFVEEELFEL